MYYNSIMEDILRYFNLEQLWLAVDLLLAAVLGFFIGLERKHREKEAGIRTHAPWVFTIGESHEGSIIPNAPA